MDLANHTIIHMNMKKIEPVDVFYAVKDEMERMGWKYVRPRQTVGDKWELGFFEVDRDVA